MNKSLNSQKSEEYVKNNNDLDEGGEGLFNNNREEMFDFNRPLYSDRVLV